MNRHTRTVLASALLGSLATLTTLHAAQPQAEKPKEDRPIRLGNFSMSLTVKDLAASRAFYEKLGFHFKGGMPDKNWVVLQNDTATIGLFQGMFEKNSLTFNPGWDRNGQTLPDFDDVRDLQKMVKEKGLTPTLAADETTTGPAFFVLTDPDGNPVLIDQHVAKPTK